MVIPPTVDLAIVAVVPIPMATTHKAIIGVLVDHLKHPVALITIPTPMVATIIKLQWIHLLQWPQWARPLYLSLWQSKNAFIQTLIPMIVILVYHPFSSCNSLFLCLLSFDWIRCFWWEGRRSWFRFRLLLTYNVSQDEHVMWKE